jgi:hypothetical protein
MKSRKSSLTFHSFQDLKDSVNFEFVCPPNRHDSELKNDENVQNPEFEEDFFGKAMEGVTPISRDNSVERICQVDPPEGFRDKEDAEILSKLADLVKYGKGFNVADTPEYIEGTGYHVPRAVAKRLHRRLFDRGPY